MKLIRYGDMNRDLLRLLTRPFAVRPNRLAATPPGIKSLSEWGWHRPKLAASPRPLRAVWSGQDEIESGGGES